VGRNAGLLILVKTLAHKAKTLVVALLLISYSQAHRQLPFLQQDYNNLQTGLKINHSSSAILYNAHRRSIIKISKFPPSASYSTPTYLFVTQPWQTSNEMAPSKKQSSSSSSNRRGEAVGNVLASCYAVDCSLNLTGFHYSTTGAGGMYSSSGYSRDKSNLL